MAASVISKAFESAAPPHAAVGGTSAHHARPHGRAWSSVYADVLTTPHRAFAALASQASFGVPLACLGAVKYLALFPHFAPTLALLQVTLAVAMQCALATFAAATWAALTWGILTLVGRAPAYRLLVTLFLVAGVWPEALGAVLEAGALVAGVYPANFDPRIDRVASLVWLLEPGASGALPSGTLRVLANGLDVPTLYQDALLAVGLPQVAPAVTQRAAVSAVIAVRCLRIVASVITA